MSNLCDIRERIRHEMLRTFYSDESIKQILEKSFAKARGLKQNKDQNIISKILIILKMNEKLIFHLRVQNNHRIWQRAQKIFSRKKRRLVRWYQVRRLL